MTIFLHTYQAYINPMELLEKLIERYLLPPQLEYELGNEITEEIQQSVLHVLRIWFSQYLRDFDSPMKKKLLEFSKDIVRECNNDLAIQARFLEKTIERKVLHMFQQQVTQNASLG